MLRLKSYWQLLRRGIKLLLAWIMVSLFGKKLLKKQIWLFEEKHTEARDNAYHLYLYVKKNHPEIDAYYVIIKGAPDEKKISGYGTTIHAETLKHYAYWLASKCSISSQPYGAAPYPSKRLHKYRSLCRKDQKVIFLQHGVIKDVLPSLDYARTGFDLFTCSAVPEAKYIWEGLHYPKENAKLVGLCRFDNLHNHQTKKLILIMPTFRHWLHANDSDADATERELRVFKESDFYHHYYELLTNESLIEHAEEYGYRIVFYLHYALQSYSKAFADCGNQTVTIADRIHYDVQQLLMDSAVLVTDFSSVFFDFAYMEKPEIFYQFDEEKYREEHYQTGYFDYRRDGFGPVFTRSDEVVDYLNRLLEKGCENEAEYVRRIQSFFPQRDAHNCERTYEAIVSIR